MDGETPLGSLLISTGELLFDSLRPVDVVVHLGAGRFALLLPRTTEQEGLRIVAGLEAALGRLLQQSPGSKQGMPMLRNTVVNCASANSGIEELISMARERLVDAPWHRVEVGKPLGSEEARRELSQDLRRMLATLGSLEESLAQPYPALLSDTPQDLLSVARSIFEFLDYNYSPTQLIHDPRLEARAQRFAGQLAKQLGALAQDVEPAINLRL